MKTTTYPSRVTTLSELRPGEVFSFESSDTVWIVGRLSMRMGKHYISLNDGSGTQIDESNGHQPVRRITKVLLEV